MLHLEDATAGGEKPAAERLSARRAAQLVARARRAVLGASDLPMSYLRQLVADHDRMLAWLVRRVRSRERAELLVGRAR